ncbi:hypothetical protein MHYP_G00286890 [Metynnis hypsauchen]
MHFLVGKDTAHVVAVEVDTDVTVFQGLLSQHKKLCTGELLNWNVFPANSKYSWAVKSIGSQKGPITISGDSLQAVYVYGGKWACGYSTTGVCNTAPRLPTPPPDPRAAIKCREREQCQKGVCVTIESATCWAVGDPHYRAFDGKQFDFQGTCTYTMSTTTNTELVPFIILAKNNHRGRNKVAYVRTVSVNVYNQTVVTRQQRGVVEVNGEITYLPSWRKATSGAEGLECAHNNRLWPGGEV